MFHGLSRLLCYVKSKPNGKIVYNSIMHGPYVRRMILKPGDPDHEVFVAESFHEQTDDDLTDKKVEVNELRTERIARAHDPLALMENSNNPYNYIVFHQDQPSQFTYMKQPQPNNNYISQPSFNQKYRKQPMLNPEDILDPTTTMNMALVLMAKAFKLNYSTPTNNNKEFHPTYVTSKLLNQNGNGIVVAVRAKGGNNGNHVRCYICRGMCHLLGIAQSDQGEGMLHIFRLEIMMRLRKSMQIGFWMANLQQSLTSSTQTDKALVYDSEGSAKVHHSENCYDNDILNIFTQEDQYTELLEPSYEPHKV
nr:hypothetical protein [Tanacetum cinerariifolium]